MKTLKLIGVAVLVAVGVFSASALELDGSKFVIVSDWPDASKELQLVLSKLTDQKVPLYTTAQAAKQDLAGKYIWRINDAHTAAPTSLGSEESAWRITPEGAWIWGGGVHGEQLGVYDCVEEGLGVRFPWAGAIACDVGTKVKVLKTEGEWKPRYRIRSLRMRGNMDQVMWRKRMRDGKHDYPGYGHAFSEYWKRFGWNKKHPEFFAMRTDGKRMPNGWGDDTAYNPDAAMDKPARYISMCVSSEAFVDQMVSDWRGKGVGGKYINLCENDAYGGTLCHCPACLALDEPRPAGSVDWWPNW